MSRSSPNLLRALGAAVLVAAAVACAPSSEQMRRPVDALIGERLNASLSSSFARADGPAETEEQMNARVDGLLADGVTATEAVQLALWMNPALRAQFAELGLAEADVLAAVTPENPELSAVARFNTAGGGADVELELQQNVLSLLSAPALVGAAADARDAARARVAGAVLRTVASARAEHVRATAAAQLLAVRRQIAATLEAAFTLATRMRDAGNLRELDVLREEVQYRDALMALRDAERNAQATSARLAAVLGLFGPRAAFTFPAELGEEPFATLPSDDFEQVAVRNSLALAGAQAALDGTAKRLGYASAQRFLPALALGVNVERTPSELLVGPSVAIALPVADLSQSELLALRATLDAGGARMVATAVELRAEARALRAQAQALDERARYLREQVLPLHARLVQEATRQYNAMQLDTFALLDARRRQFDASTSYILTLRDAWLTRIDVDALTQGGQPVSAPAGDMAPGDASGGAPDAAVGGGH